VLLAWRHKTEACGYVEPLSKDGNSNTQYSVPGRLKRNHSSCAAARNSNPDSRVLYQPGYYPGARTDDFGRWRAQKGKSSENIAPVTAAVRRTSHYNSPTPLRPIS
jgi:hypothetical protein